jgi:hypothetical protein
VGQVSKQAGLEPVGSGGGAFQFLQYRNKTGTDDHLFNDHLHE